MRGLAEAGRVGVSFIIALIGQRKQSGRGAIEHLRKKVPSLEKDGLGEERLVIS